MATAGRKRKSVQELKLHGMYGKRSSHKDYNEDVPNPIVFKSAPKRYLQRTKIAWNEFMRVKCTQGILSEEDNILVEMMFDSLNHYFYEQDELDNIQKKLHLDSIAKKGEDKDKDRLSPEEREELRSAKVQTIKARNTFKKEFDESAIKFGLSPTERTKLIIPEKKKESELMLFLKEG